MFSRSKLISLPFIAIGTPLVLLSYDQYKYNLLLKKSFETAKTKGMKITECTKVPKILILIKEKKEGTIGDDISLFRKTCSKLLTYSGVDYELIEFNKINGDELKSLIQHYPSGKEKTHESNRSRPFNNILIWGDFKIPLLDILFENNKNLNLFSFKHESGWFNKTSVYRENIEGLMRFIDKMEIK